MSRKLWMGLLACLLVIVIALPLSAQEATTLTPVRVFMPFIPNIQFAPVYVAIEQGYFDDEGLDVSLEYGAEPDGLELIAVGEIDYGFISGEQVIIARANERPTTYVYEWYQQNPVAMLSVVPVAEGEEPPGLENLLVTQSVGIPGRFGATYAAFVALLNHFELTEAEVQVEEIGFNAPEVLCVGGVSVAAVYINNEPIQVRERAAAEDCAADNVTVFPVSDYVDLVSNGIVTSDEKITQEAEQVAGFVRAFERGLIDTIQNPHAAYIDSVPHIEGLPFENAAVFEDLSTATGIFLADAPDDQAIADRRDFLYAQSRPVLNADELLQFEVLLESIKLWDVAQLGETEAASWEETQNALLSAGFITAPIDLQMAYTNEFVPALAEANE